MYVCTCVCMWEHTYLCTGVQVHRHPPTPLEQNELIVRRGHIQCSERAQRRRNLTQAGGVREGFPEEATLSWKHQGGDSQVQEGAGGILGRGQLCADHRGSL